MKHRLFASVDPYGKKRCPFATTNPFGDEIDDRLHKLCQDAHTTVEDVQQFLCKHPNAATMLDSHGRTALFYALKLAYSTGIISTLFRANPEAVVQPDFCGESSMDHLFHPCNHPSILELILEENPTLVLHRTGTFSNKPLLHRICDLWHRQEIFPCERIASGAWAKLVLSVRAAHRVLMSSNKDDDVVVPELHMALELGLPSYVLSDFCRFYPEQVSLPMTIHNGMLPLHYVILMISGKDKGSADLIRDMLAHYPKAASSLHIGSYPLQLALGNGFMWDTGIREMTFACPDALQTPTECGLLPFQLAASMPDCDLDTIYCLLRERPIIPYSG